MSEETHLIDEVIAEVRKHPGIIAGGVAVLAAVGFASLFLNQRTGPRRYEVMMDRFDPRGWLDTEALRERLYNFGDRVHHDAEDFGQRASGRVQGLKSRAADAAQDIGGRAQGLGQDLGDRAREFADIARDKFDDWRGHAPRRRKKHHYMKRARRAAEDARDYASDHKTEGAALLAVAVVAAAIGAIAIEQRKLKGD